MKIIVSDFDGTFFNNQYEQNINIINKFVDQGNIFVIATGRGKNNLEKDIQDKKIKYTYLICNDGATIYNNKNENLFTSNINRETIYKVCELLDNDENISFTLLENDMYASASIASAISAKFIDRDIADKTMKNIVERFEDLTAYLSTHFINIRNKTTSKKEGIKILQEKFQINSEDIFVIGDDVNDIEMCEEYKSFTYENTKIKNYTKYVVKDFKNAVEKIMNDEW